MRIIVGADHAGFYIKEEIKRHLQAKGYDVEDVGTYSPESVDYPDFAHKVAQIIQSGKGDFGILVCGSGIGVSIVANRYRGVRAALCFNEEFAFLARSHNDANVLCLPGRFLSIIDAIKITEKFLGTAFEGGRHLRRINKIDNF